MITAAERQACAESVSRNAGDIIPVCRNITIRNAGDRSGETTLSRFLARPKA